MAPKAVFDTNIYISAIVFGGSARLCLELARSGRIELFTSKALLLELSRVLQEKFNWSGIEVRDLVRGLAKFVKIVNPQKKVAVIKDDPTDNRVLEAAQQGRVDFIVSGDKKHLLSLGSFNNVPIISAADFLTKVIARA